MGKDLMIILPVFVLSLCVSYLIFLTLEEQINLVEKCQALGMGFVDYTENRFELSEPVLTCRNLSHVCRFRVIDEVNGKFLLSLPDCSEELKK